MPICPKCGRRILFGSIHACDIPTLDPFVEETPSEVVRLQREIEGLRQQLQGHKLPDLNMKFPLVED